MENSKSVEQYLNTVDYEFADYVPSKAALEFITFIKLVNGGEGEENKTPVVHYKLLDNIFTKKKRLAVMCHRGFGKTTLIAEYLFMYIAIYGKLPNFGDVNLALYVADSAEGGAKNLRKNIEFRYNQSEFMQKYVPIIRFTDTRLEFQNLEGKTFIVKMYGSQGNIRGTKEQGTRPQLAIMDDLYSDQDAKSPTVIENIDNNIYKAIGKALHPKNSKMVLIGTPFNTRESLYKAVESGAWDVSVYPICEQFPCTKEEFKGSWEDRFPYEYVQDEYTMAVKSGMVSAFNQELMLRILSAEDRLIQDSDMVFYDRDIILKNKSRYNFYITTDFATSEKTSADYSVISVWAYNNNGDWLWVDGVCKRQLMDKNIDDLFRFVSMYKPQSVGVEVTGQQGAFIQWLQSEMVERNIFFNLASDSNSSRPGIRPNTNKMVRFNTVVPLFKAKKIWFPKNMEEDPFMAEMMDELRNASAGGFKSKHDDVIDTISMLMVLNPWKPSEEIPYKIVSQGGSSDMWVELEEEEDYQNNSLIF